MVGVGSEIFFSGTYFSYINIFFNFIDHYFSISTILNTKISKENYVTNG